MQMLQSVSAPALLRPQRQTRARSVRLASVQGVHGAPATARRCTGLAQPRMLRSVRLSAAAAAGGASSGASGVPATTTGANAKEEEKEEEKEPQSWEKNPLKEFGKTFVADEVIVGTLGVLFLSETLRFMVEVVAPLPAKVMAGAFLALSIDFGIMGMLQLRNSRDLQDRGVDVKRFRLCLYFKLLAEIGGLALLVLKQEPGLGAALSLGGHLLFNSVNNEVMGVTPSGVIAVRPLPFEARKVMVIFDGILTALCLASWATVEAAPMVSLGAAGIVAAFAVYYLGMKYVLKKKL